MPHRACTPGIMRCAAWAAMRRGLRTVSGIMSQSPRPHQPDTEVELSRTPRAFVTARMTAFDSATPWSLFDPHRRRCVSMAVDRYRLSVPAAGDQLLAAWTRFTAVALTLCSTFANTTTTMPCFGKHSAAVVNPRRDPVWPSAPEPYSDLLSMIPNPY